MNRRIGAALLTMLGAAALSFLLVELAPGDYFSAARLSPGMTPELLEQLRARYALDAPWWQRSAQWLWNLLQLDWGYSLVRELPVWPLLRERLAATLALAVSAQLFAWALALTLAFAAGRRPGGWIDRIVGASATLLLCVPEVVLALLAVLLLAVLHGDAAPWSAALLALTLAVLPANWLQARQALAGAATAPYVAAAQANGIGGLTLALRYLLPGAAPTLLAAASLSLGSLLSASLLIECLTAYPGLGPLLLDAVLARDAHVVAGAVLLSAGLWALGALFIDLLHWRIDPRLRRTP